MTEDGTTWLSPEAHKRLVDELEHLMTDGRQEVTERIAEARSHGDIRENADYEAAKNEQGLMEARIRKIQSILDTADGGEMDVFVATQENKVPGHILASPSSPLGAALLGASVGDKVSYEAPSGTFHVTVVAIKPFEG
jgi:transcription elongation factor GreA